MFNKSLIQFSVDGWSCAPSLLFTWLNYGGGNEDNGVLLQKAPCRHCCTQCPKPTTGHHPCLHWRLLDTHMQVWVSLCGVTAPLFWVMVPTWFYLCPARVCFPVLCKFWQLYSEVNCDLLQEDICHTQVSCTQSLYPCNSPLFTCTFAGDTLTQFCLSLCGVSGS